MPRADSTSYASDATPELRGSTLPRLWTPPHALHSPPHAAPGPCGCGCGLTETTTLGFDVDWFAEHVLAAPLLPWQRWLVIHALELHPDGSGRPRFDTVLLLVARQNGKSHLGRVLTLFWLAVEQVGMVLGTSTNLDYAREQWLFAVALAEDTPDLADEITDIRRANGEQCLTLGRSRYRIAASNRRGGRSLTVNRLLEDELREHRSWDAHNAADNAMNAVPDSQAWLLSNAGDDGSVVLNATRDTALAQIAAAAPPEDPIGLFEWSAPEGCDVLDPAGWAAANPALGYLITVAKIRAKAERVAASSDPEEIAGFRTEVLCQRVPRLDAAVSPEAWSACASADTMDAVRDRVVLCLDVAPGGRHATLVAAAPLDDGRVRVEVVAAWTGPTAMKELRRDLAAHVRRVSPRAIGWFPNGPAAALAAELRRRRAGSKPGAAKPKLAHVLYGSPVEEITTEAAAVCMGLAEQVAAGQVLHPADELLTSHVTGAEKLKRGDGGGWVFSRKGEGHCDAAYAAAGAVHLARTLPPSVGKPRIVRPRSSRTSNPAE